MLNKQFCRNGISVDAPDSLISVEDGGLCNEALHAPHATVHHVNGDLSDLHMVFNNKKRSKKSIVMFRSAKNENNVLIKSYF